MPDDAGAARQINAPPAQDALAAKPGMSRTRKVVLAVAALVVAIVAGVSITQWMLVGSHVVETDNAYVRADISVVSAQVEGRVNALPVRENQQVRAGDVLVRIDAADYAAAVATARANIARARAQAAASAANNNAAAAQLRRYERLAEQGLLSTAGLDAARAQAGQWGGSTRAALADVQAAEAQLAAAELDLQRTIIRAPIDGVIGNRTVQVGQLLRPGTPLMAIVPHELYVEANFKETQLANVRPGQSAEIRPDIDPSLRLRGVVESLSPASGSEFSFIPTETATGNFTKIVQRVPVRIRIEATPAARALLRPGLSVTAAIDTRTGE